MGFTSSSAQCTQVDTNRYHHLFGPPGRRPPFPTMVQAEDFTQNEENLFPIQQTTKTNELLLVPHADIPILLAGIS
jgi:hypothetical protein